MLINRRAGRSPDSRAILHICAWMPAAAAYSCACNLHMLKACCSRPATGWHATPNNTRQSKCRHPAAGDLPHSARAQWDCSNQHWKPHTLYVKHPHTYILWLIHSRVPTPTWQQCLYCCATPGHTQSSHLKPAWADTDFATHRTTCMFHAMSMLNNITRLPHRIMSSNGLGIRFVPLSLGLSRATASCKGCQMSRSAAAHT